MADAAKVATSVISDSMIGSFIPIALVPNLVGAKAAWDIGLKEITYVISASEKHNQANVNRSIDESLAGLEKISNQYPEMNIRLDMATAFGCPFAGKTPDQSVVDLAKKGLERGAKEIVLCDTIGVANPFQVNRVCARMLAEFPETPLAVHLHDTRGMGLANTLAAMAAGVAIVETSVGGLGGCPFAPGAAGNSATEDLINMLMSMNIECGLNLEAYLAVVGLVREKTTGRVTDHLSQACLYGGLTF
jgi:hydroxymethylglutaryl-CoA lyase